MLSSYDTISFIFPFMSFNYFIHSCFRAETLDWVLEYTFAHRYFLQTISLFYRKIYCLHISNPNALLRHFSYNILVYRYLNCFK